MIKKSFSKVLKQLLYTRKLKYEKLTPAFLLQITFESPQRKNTNSNRISTQKPGRNVPFNDFWYIQK